MAAMGSTIGLHSQFLIPTGVPGLSDNSASGESFSFQGTIFSTVDHTHAVEHVLLCWGFLALMIVVFGVSTAYFLKKKDVRR
jgi:ABC-type sulfate transport system permease component